MSLFVYDGLKSLPAGGAGKGQVYPCANVVGGRMQASELQSQATSGVGVVCFVGAEKKETGKIPHH